MAAVKIPLTKGYFTLIDEEDLPLVEGKKFNVVFKRKGGKPYASTSKREGVKTKKTLLHRMICSTELHVDHINGDTLDNRRSNLRPATNSQNHRNIGKFKCKTSSNFKGVTKRRYGFEVNIKAEGVQKYLGSFKCEVEAANAYDKAAIKYFGEFALTNKMLGLYK